ncbi:MAG: hypothetical protein KBH07_00175 [Flavobacteriales bacterium]|nr:hypothetical protein [Flavobacteriales bacterium]MBP9079077.1 hypothetical protein [Flavobacteriales bacterium]
MAPAQAQDNRVVRRIVLDRDTVVLDSLSIVPGSFSLWSGGAEIPPDRYRLDPFQGLLLRTAQSPQDTLTATYRRMPLMLGGQLRHKDPEQLLRPSGDRYDPFKYVPPKQSEDLFGMGGLDKSGSISRGILFGNNQDLSVNSTMNLELNGHLTDKIQVQASVTDNNIPIQAGGNTLELQDFDRVFIRLFDDRQELVAGDLVLQRPSSHFLNYHKKTKGLSYGTRMGPLDGVHGRFGLSAAISKGSFARNQLQGIEGVQGPYRLTAPGGGTFIIVLSGTEQVYVDGLLLSRGMDHDYVIDYNAGTLTFTAKRPITKDSRITVEFQYSDKNYARSLLQAGQELALGGTLLRLHLYSEQDHRGQSLQQALTDPEKLALAGAGDDPLQAVVPGVDSVAFSADEVLYAKVDSLGWSPVYRYSTHADSARYRVVFSAVGAGNGDYVLQEFTPNGRVFRWLAPDTVGGGISHRGDQSPVRVLVPPRHQRMATLGAEHLFTPRSKVWGEVAVSNEDQNTFSTLDDADNTGLAVRIGGVHAIPLSAVDTAKKLVLGSENEWRSTHLTVVERYRPVEFDRDWNLAGVVQDGSQGLASASIGFVNGDRGRLDLTGSIFQIDQRFRGIREALAGKMRFGRFDAALDGSLLRTDTEGEGSGFLRNKAMLSRRFKGFALGLSDELEANRFRSDSLDRLLPGSYAYHQWEAFLQSPDSARAKFRVAGGQRTDQAYREGTLAASTEATNYTATMDLGGRNVRKLATAFTYRRLRILDSTLTAQRAEDTYLARVDHGHTAWKGVLSWDLFYEFGSGLEQRQEYLYVQVPAGQGAYVWLDYNGDGVKDLNEFEAAPFSYEADYIRVFVQSNEMVRVYNNQFSASGELRPAAMWREAQGLRGFLAKWNNLFSFRSDRKTASDEPGAAMNPFLLDPADSLLIALNSSLRNTVYYDRSSRSWSMDHTIQSDRGKSLLLNGFDTRVRESQLVHVRWNAWSRWTLEAEGSTGRSTSTSDLLSGRNYAISESSAAPKLTWQPGTRMRGAVRFKYTDKQNQAELGGEGALLRDLGLEYRLNVPDKGSMQFNGNLVEITYDGTVESSLGTEMLGGLKPGTNITWSVALQRRISDHLQVDLTYNGRTSPGTPTVHVGGAQVRAFF